VAGAAKGERRYRYYVSRRLVTGSADKVRNGWRLSGPEIERTVAVAARQLLNDHAAISASACNLGVGAGDVPAVLEAAGKWSRSLQSEVDIPRPRDRAGSPALGLHFPGMKDPNAAKRYVSYRLNRVAQAELELDGDDLSDGDNEN
jgi:hypothetical protein